MLGTMSRSGCPQVDIYGMERVMIDTIIELVRRINVSIDMTLKKNYELMKKGIFSRLISKSVMNALLK
jgi:hypothetical protein